MKKISKLFLLPLLCCTFSSLSGCSRSSKTVKLTYGEILHQQYHQISYAKLQQMIDAKESFLLVVDPKGCACFRDFMNASEEYIIKKQLVLYYMTVADFTGNETKGIKVIEGSTSFSIFNKGVIQQSIASNSSENIMKKKADFEEYIDQYITKPNMYFVNAAVALSLYHKEDKSLIYFARNKCGDCSYINQNFLYDYMYERDEILYIVDGDDGIRKYDEQGNLINPDEWQAFKDVMGLSNKYNPKYGYETGYVPTFLVVSGTESETTYHSGVVAFNETLTQIEGGDYKMTSNYFSQSRMPYLDYLDETYGALENTIIAKEYVEKGWWPHDASSKVYFPRVQAFLDKYLPQCNQSKELFIE